MRSTSSAMRVRGHGHCPYFASVPRRPTIATGAGDALEREERW
jgi:hypothetical protein